MSNHAEYRKEAQAPLGTCKTSDRPRGMRALDGVIMLSPDGRPAGGSFPDNVWIVMGGDEDSIEEFFGDCDDVITAGMADSGPSEDTRFCVGFDACRQNMVMNGCGTFPVYVSGLLKLHLEGQQR